MNRFGLLVAVFLAPASVTALAQDVQRCQGADGRVSYVNGACPHGVVAVRVLPAAGAPTPDERKAAQQRAQSDVRRAEALDRARLAEEQRAAREQERQLAEAKKQKTHCRRLQTAWRYAQDDLATARSHKRAEAQRRVARAEDLYREDCDR